MLQLNVTLRSRLVKHYIDATTTFASPSSLRRMIGSAACFFIYRAAFQLEICRAYSPTVSTEQ